MSLLSHQSCLCLFFQAMRPCLDVIPSGIGYWRNTASLNDLCLQNISYRLCPYELIYKSMKTVRMRIRHTSEVEETMLWLCYVRHNYVCSATYEKAELFVITSIIDRYSIILTKMLLYIIYAVCFEEFIEDYMRQLMGFLLLVYECFRICSSSNITCWIKGVKSIVRKCTLSILGHKVGYVWRCSFIFALCYVYNYTSRKVYVYGFAFVVFGMLIVFMRFFWLEQLLWNNIIFLSCLILNK